MRGLVVGPRDELSKDLCNLIVTAATAAVDKNWAELGEESSTLARAKISQTLRKEDRSCWSQRAGRLDVWKIEQVRMQKRGGSGPLRRAKAQQARRSRRAQREYFDTHAGFARADWRRG